MKRRHKRPAQLDPWEDTDYALEKANEALGYKPSKTGFMEVFIIIALVIGAIVALNDCT